MLQILQLIHFNDRKQNLYWNLTSFQVLLAKERVVAVEREQRRMQLQLEEAEQLQGKLRLMEEEADRAKEEYDQITARVRRFVVLYEIELICFVRCFNLCI